MLAAALVEAGAAALEKAEERLGRLDAAAGDGDTGASMAAAARAVRVKLAEEEIASPIGMVVAAATAVSQVGGAMGAIGFMILDELRQAMEPSPATADGDQGPGAWLHRLFAAMEASVAEFGGASRGDKSILDAIGAAADATAEPGGDVGAVLARAAEGARLGAESTAAMRAKIGRAARAADRSVGTVDAGAEAFALVLETVSAAYGQLVACSPGGQALSDRGRPVGSGEATEAPGRWSVVLGSDDAGVEYRKAIKAQLEVDPRVSKIIELGPEPGEEQSYPDVAIEAGKLIRQGVATRGILLCGTGLGMAMTANKVPGVRAGTAHDSYSVERLVRSNDAQVLCLGQRVVGVEVAKRLAWEWLAYSFDSASKSAAKVDRIRAYEGALPETMANRDPLNDQQARDNGGNAPGKTGNERHRD